jgi:peptide/nickel transport system substrate-binding protein
MMAVAGGVVAKQSFIEQAGKDFGTPDGGLMCTGPFQLENWSKGESITLTRYDGYWDADGAARAETVEFSFLPDAAALANALISGAVDGTYGVPEAALKKVQNSDAGDVYYGRQTSTRNLIVADLEGPLQDVRIRQALSLALDREGFANAAIPGPSEPSRAVASKLTWGEGPAGDMYAEAWDELPAPAQDIEQAKKLVAEAGAPDRPIVIAQSPAPVQQVLANEVQAAGKRIGLDVEIKPIAAEAYSSLFGDAEARKGIDLFHTTWYADVADPLQIYVNWQSDNFANYGGWSDAEYDALVDEALQENDPEARASMVVELQQKVTENVLWIPVDHSANSVFLSKRITGAPATNAYLYYPWAAQLGARG